MTSKVDSKDPKSSITPDSNDDGGDDNRPPTYKMTHLLCSEEPDLTIVVGGKEYKEYSPTIRCWSQYFDAALKSGMKETVNKRFELPDMDPKEWEWIMELMEPMATTRVTEDTVYTALAWFDRLCCPKGLKECDRILCNDIISTHLTKTDISMKEVVFTREGAIEKRPSLDKVLDSLNVSIQYSLPDSKSKCFEIVKECFSNAPYIFGPEQIARIISLLDNNEDCRWSLWPSVETYLPSTSYNDSDKEAMIKNNLFPSLLLYGMELKQSAVVEKTIRDELKQSAIVAKKIRDAAGLAASASSATGWHAIDFCGRLRDDKLKY